MNISHDKNNNKYFCIKCNFKGNCISDLNRHTSTKKHRMTVMTNILRNHENPYQCYCGKVYKQRSSLCKHKKTCKLYKTL